MTLEQIDKHIAVEGISVSQYTVKGFATQLIFLYPLQQRFML